MHLQRCSVSRILSGIIFVLGLFQIKTWLRSPQPSLMTRKPNDVMLPPERNYSLDFLEQDEGNCPDISLMMLMAIDVDATQSVSWKVQHGTRELFMSSAYLDRRPTIRVHEIKVFGVLHKDAIHSANEKLTCLIWYPGRNNPVIAKATIDKMWGYTCPYHTVVLSCPIMEDTDGTFVSISNNGCDTQPSNVLQVLRSPDRRMTNQTEQVAVCTKVLYGQPDAVRLVEWIELLHILGASNIYLYNSSVGGQANDVLRYYEDKGMVSVIPHTFLSRLATRLWGSTFPTNSFQQNWELEILSMNDCLYRAKEKYLVNIDIDEILHLKSKYYEYMTDIEKTLPRPASFVFKTGVYSNELGADSNETIPRYLHMMTHDRRTKIDYESPKSILRRWYCLVAGHHVCLNAIYGHPMNFHVDPSQGHLHHYRRKCRLTGEPQKCKKLLMDPIKDTGLHQYLGELEAKTKPVLDRFKLI